MARSRFGWTAALLTAALACAGRPTGCAADGTASELLKEHGLKIAGSLAVVDMEADIKDKLKVARRLSQQLNYSLMQQQGTASPKDLQQTIKTLGTQINQLRSEMNAVNQRMSQVPRNNSRYGRFGGGMSFVNNDAAEMYAELLVYRNQLQAEINQGSLFLNQLKSQNADPKAKENIDTEVRDRRDAYHQALLDIRKLVDSAAEKYAALARNDDVKNALAALGKGMREKPKLGPSHEFLASVKLLEKLEKAASNGETEWSSAKPARRSRYGTKSKHSAKAAAGATAPEASGNSGGPP